MKLAVPLLMLALVSCSTHKASTAQWEMSTMAEEGRDQYSLNLGPLFLPELFPTFVEESTPWKVTLKAMPGSRLTAEDTQGLARVRGAASATLEGEPFISLVSADYWLEAKDGSTLDLSAPSSDEALHRLGAAIEEGFLEGLTAHDGRSGKRARAVLRVATPGPVLSLKFNGQDRWGQDFAASFRVELDQEEGSDGRVCARCFGWVGTRHESESTSTK